MATKVEPSHQSAADDVVSNVIDELPTFGESSKQRPSNIFECGRQIFAKIIPSFHSTSQVGTDGAVPSTTADGMGVVNLNIFERGRKMLELDETEIDAFKDLSRFMSPNPRKIKRITNIYRCARLLALEDEENSSSSSSLTPVDRGGRSESLVFLNKLLVWIILLEQWPVRMGWILQVLEDDEQSDKMLSLSNTSLAEVYYKYVETRVYNTQLQNCSPNLQETYQKIFSLDADPEWFDELIVRSTLCIDDVGGFYVRSKKHLLSYVINLNPALRSLLSSIAGQRENVDQLIENVQSKFTNRSIRTLEKGMIAWSCDEVIEWFKNTKLSFSDAVYEKLAENQINGLTMHRLMTQGADSKPRYDALNELGLGSLLRVEKIVELWSTSRSKYDDARGQNKSRLAALSADKVGTAAPSRRVGGKKSAGINTAITSGAAVAGASMTANPVAADSPVVNEEAVAGEHVVAQSRTTDDKSGKDHVGYLSYSVALAQLVHIGVSTPVVFGLYASWGTGKSFIMNKSIAAMQMLWLNDRISDYLKTNWENERLLLAPLKENKKNKQTESGILRVYQNELEELLKTNEEQIDLYYKWYILRCPLGACDLNGSASFELLKDKVFERWEQRNPPFFWQEAFVDLATGIFGRTYRFLHQRVDGKRKSIASSTELWGILYRTFEFNIKIKHPIGKSTKSAQFKANDEIKGQKKVEVEKAEFDYEFIWWNAWLYSGSDNLWAGLIKELYTAAEGHFGKEYTNAQQKAKAYALMLQSALAMLCFIVAVYFLKYQSDFISVVVAFAAVVTTVIASIGVVYTQLFSPSKSSDSLVMEVSDPSFRNKLGFMATIKDALGSVGQMLQTKNNLPCMWDYLLPNWLGALKDPCKSLLGAIFGGVVVINPLQSRPCKLIIFVDDLDRCSPEKSVEVLQSLVLLTENTPFAIFLAIDPRIVVTAIESVNANFFSQCGVSGYEYLDKIVHIPFAIPPLVASEKADLCRGYLTGNCKEILKELTLTGHTETVHAVAVLPDGNKIVSGSADKTVRLWDVKTGKCLLILDGHTDLINTVAVTPDGKRVISGAWDDTIRIWDISAGNCLNKLVGHNGFVIAVAVFSDGNIIVSGSADETLRIWDIYTGECLQVLEGHSGHIGAVAVLPDGSGVVSGSTDKTVRLWNTITGELQLTLEGHTHSVYAVAILPNAETIVSGSTDTTLRLWSIATGMCLLVLNGHTGAIGGVAVLPDGNRIVSAAGDQTIRLWDVKTGKCLLVVEGDAGPIFTVAVLLDGTRIISGAKDTKIRVWNLETRLLAHN